MQNSGKAIAALVLGLMSLSFCFFLTAIPAMVVGRMAQKEVDASGGRLNGRGMGTAGLVLGIISTVIFAALVAIFGIIAATGGCTDTSSGGTHSFNCSA